MSEIDPNKLRYVKSKYKGEKENGQAKKGIRGTRVRYESRDGKMIRYNIYSLGDGIEYTQPVLLGEEKPNPHPTTEVKPEKPTLKQKIKVWIAGVVVFAFIGTAVGVPITFIGKAIEKNIDKKKKEDEEKEKEKATEITEIKSLNKAMNLRKNPTFDDEDIIGFSEKDTLVLATDGFRDVQDKENENLIHRFRNCYVGYQDKWQQVWIDEGTRNADKENEEPDDANMEKVENSFADSTIDTIIKQKNQVTGKPVNIFGQTQGVCLQQGDNKYDFAYLMKNDKNNEDMELVIVTLSGDVLQERSKQNTQSIFVEDVNTYVQYTSVKKVNTDVQYAIARAEDMDSKHFKYMPYSPKNFRDEQKIEGWKFKPVTYDLDDLQKIAQETSQDRV